MSPALATGFQPGRERSPRRVEPSKFFFYHLLATGAVLGVICFEAAVFEGLPGLQRRYLLACLANDQRHSHASVALTGHILVQRSINQGLVLDLVWQIGRPARLEPPEEC